MIVKWMRRGPTGIVDSGLMEMSDVEKTMTEFSKKARKVLEQTGADHVVYGVKKYNTDGDLMVVHFCVELMDDIQFQKDVASMKNAHVYALHKRTAGKEPLQTHMFCRSCGHEFDGPVYMDDLGPHGVCPKCDASFDWDVI